MKRFMDKNFLLSTPTAQTLYHEFAEMLPIVDYHCHVSPKEIYEDRHFDNIAQAWLAGDHYKWRIMRSDGVEETYITGDAPDREKFQKFAESLPRAIGNPMYHWCHLELKNYFGYEGVLNGDTAQEVWQLTSEKLKKPDMGVRGLIAKSNVAFIGTTDDPTDSLVWHKRLAEDETMQTRVAPSFRPDKAFNIDKQDWKEYINTLSQVSGIEIVGLDSLENALRSRMEYFDAHGCKASDHGLDRICYRLADRNTADIIVKKVLNGGTAATEEAEIVKSVLLLFCAAEYHRLGWVMQLHYNCMRNPNTEMFVKLGPDTGFDCIGPNNGSVELAKLLDTLYATNSLPKTILYSLDSGDNAFLDALIGSFQGGGERGRLQHGCAWWFNDNKHGMREQLISLANLSLLGNFVGMLTDSRSFLSYTRHEYFRRILCDFIGSLIENGEYPDDMTVAGGLVQDICCYNAMRYFRLEED